MTVLGIDAGSTTVRAAEHLLQRVLGEVLGAAPERFACTHVVRGDHPHAALSVTVDAAELGLVEPVAPGAPGELREPGADGGLAALSNRLGIAELGLAWQHERYGPPSLAAGAAFTAGELAARSTGRAVVFPGVDALVGTLTVREVLARSAVDEIVVVGGPPATLDDAVDTRDFVRPEWRDGRLVLAVTPAGGGVLAPFEVPNPTACCADHA